MQGAYLDILQPVAWVINQLIFLLCTIYLPPHRTPRIVESENQNIWKPVYHGDRGVFDFSPKTLSNTSLALSVCICCSLS